jgi:hypothetical protein
LQFLQDSSPDLWHGQHQKCENHARKASQHQAQRIIALPSKLIETYSMNTNWARVRNFNVMLIAIFSFVSGESLKSEDFPYVNRKNIINHPKMFDA